jgi:hypothetical protein
MVNRRPIATRSTRATWTSPAKATAMLACRVYCVGRGTTRPAARLLSSLRWSLRWCRAGVLHKPQCDSGRVRPAGLFLYSSTGSPQGPFNGSSIRFPKAVKLFFNSRKRCAVRGAARADLRRSANSELRCAKAHLPTYLPTRRGLRPQNLPTYLPTRSGGRKELPTYLPTYLTSTLCSCNCM